MTDEVRIPIVEEQARLVKRSVATERVSVRTSAAEEHVVFRDQVERGHVDITHVVRDEEVTEAPPIRTEGDVTIIPIVEERLVVEKRLFLVEEVHLRRVMQIHDIEAPATLRRTQVAIDREDLTGDRD